MKLSLNICVLICLISFCSFDRPSVKTSAGQQENEITNDTCWKIDAYLTRLENEKHFSGGLLITKKGKKIFCKGYGWADIERKIPFTTATPASMGSITKAFTAAAIMKLAEQGKLTVSDRLSGFFPKVPADKADITIHQLLTHSSGFHEFLKADGGDYERINKDEFLERAFTEPLAFRPGEKAVYTNVGMSILGIIIEQVSGQDYEDYLKKNLFEPAGILNIGYHFPQSVDDMIAVGYQNGKRWGTHQGHFDKAGGGPFWNLKANGGLEASLEDMFLWTNSFRTHSVLKDSTIRKMFTPYIQEEGNDGNSSFGYGCNISPNRRNTITIDNGGSNGIYFARLIRLPEEDIIFYMVTNESSINTNMVLPNITQIFFEGTINRDATVEVPGFDNPLSRRIYEIIDGKDITDLKNELAGEKIEINDDMILLEVGQKLMDQKKISKALILYKYYTETFPEIVVAWNDLGDIYLLQNNPDEAAKCYRQALLLRPENPRARQSLDKIGKNVPTIK